jgi:hypothetical protein
MKYRMVFGFTLLIGILVLAFAIALGKVEEKTSYGLLDVLTILALLAKDFTHWAFVGEKDAKETNGLRPKGEGLEGS